MPSASNIETPLIKVPFESLKRAAKERKAIVDEATRALSGIACFTRDSEITEESASAHLGTLVEKLHSLKRKLDEVAVTEREGAERSQARLKHLADIGEPSEEGVVQWNAERIDRLLADYFLRNGCNDSATAIIASSKLQHLVDARIFRDAGKVIDGLKNHNCQEALAWCVENRTKLKKIKSKLEFRLHLQVFIEHVRENEMMKAIEYAKRNLAPWAQQQMAEFQRVIATLAFKADTKCERYRELFEEGRWEMIVVQFYDALYKLNCLTSESLLNIHLQAGLSALKTPRSYEPGCCQEDPLHLSAFQKLADGLPFAKYDRSKLICSVTREIMNADNPPKALPNGYVYSSKAIEQMKDQNGKIVCPCTGEVCEESDVRRVFIV